MNSVFETHGAFSWTELITSGVPGARDFYGRLFGWQFADMPMKEGGTYTVISAGGQKIGGIMHTPPQAQGMPPAWGSYVTVDDVDARANDAQKFGGRIIMPPTDIPGVGRFCVIQDPQGAVISLITYRMAQA